MNKKRIVLVDWTVCYRVKKVQFEIQKKIIEYKKRKMNMPKKTTQKENKDQDLQWAIFRFVIMFFVENVYAPLNNLVNI